MKLSKMNSIEQFRNAVKNIISSSRFMGFNDDGEPIIDKLQPLPKVEFTGTVKLHGTNASVGFDHNGNMWTQSKENIITPEKDNFGFSQFALSKKHIFTEMFKKIHIEENQNLYIYGEWAGQGIQKGVAISELPKSFYIFSIKVVDFHDDGSIKSTRFIPWQILDIVVDNMPEHNIYNLHMFKKYSVVIEMSQPHIAQNEITEIVESIENECPVSKRLGVSGIGEGVVFTGEYKNNHYTFKAKGEKHAGKSKIKKLNKVDDSRINLINETVNKVLPVWRLDQFYNDLFTDGTDRTKIGDYIRLVISDIVKEDLDVLTDSGLTVKDIGGPVSSQVKKYFFERESQV